MIDSTLSRPEIQLSRDRIIPVHVLIFGAPIGGIVVRLKFQHCPFLTVSVKEIYFSDIKRSFVAETDKKQAAVGMNWVCKIADWTDAMAPLKYPKFRQQIGKVYR